MNNDTNQINSATGNQRQGENRNAAASPAMNFQGWAG